jgi:hypothetical protein
MTTLSGPGAVSPTPPSEGRKGPLWDYDSR